LEEEEKEQDDKSRKKQKEVAGDSCRWCDTPGGVNDNSKLESARTIGIFNLQVHSRSLPSFIVNPVLGRIGFVIRVWRSDVYDFDFVEEFMVKAKGCFVFGEDRLFSWSHGSTTE